MKRRELFTLMGGMTATALVASTARAQTMPVIGFLNGGSPDAFSERLRGFRAGLLESGYVERQNLMIECRWAESNPRRLPELAAELVCRRVAVIAATGGRATTLAAKAATKTIPIVFGVADDPVKSGIVVSLARPEGNLTGVNFLIIELASKRLELLRELVPGAKRVALLVNPADASGLETVVREATAAGRVMGLEIRIVNASSPREIDAAFAALGRDRPDVLFVSGGVLFTDRRIQLVHLATRHAIPAAYAQRDFAEAGGLMSYGSSVIDAYRQVGAYAGRILKGAKPADLPVVQSSKFELVINNQTARILGLTVPAQFLARSDEVIE